MNNHPCFNREAQSRFCRVHLPVAARCNIVCGYCDRRYACPHESRPGVTARLMSPDEACEAAVTASRRMPDLAVAGIAGPGDPLANPQETLQTLHLVRQRLPRLLLCLSTNGLALPEYADALAAAGVSHVTVTVNAVDPAIGARICRSVRKDGAKLAGEVGAELLLRRQRLGIARLRHLNLAVKVNTVVVPGVNDTHVPDIARAVAAWGADMMNCIPIIPVRGTPLASCPAPSAERMERIRDQAQAYLPQMRHCARCRADAAGRLGDGGVLQPLASCPGASFSANTCHQGETA